MSRYVVDAAALSRVDELPAVSGALDDLALAIAAEAEAAAPVDTGRLRASGFVDSEGSDRRVGFTAEYARYVEFGTSDTDAQPFLSPAALKRRG